MSAAARMPEHCFGGHCGKLCRWSHLISSAQGPTQLSAMFKALPCYAMCQAPLSNPLARAGYRCHVVGPRLLTLRRFHWYVFDSPRKQKNWERKLKRDDSLGLSILAKVSSAIFARLRP